MSHKNRILLIWKYRSAQLTYPLWGPDNEMRELTAIEQCPSLRERALVGAFWKPVYWLLKARLSACSLKCQAVMIHAKNSICLQINIAFQIQYVQGCEGEIVWMCSFGCWYFTVNCQFMSPHFVRFHSLGDFYFITIISSLRGARMQSVTQQWQSHPTKTASSFLTQWTHGSGAKRR